MYVHAHFGRRKSGTTLNTLITLQELQYYGGLHVVQDVLPPCHAYKHMPVYIYIYIYVYMYIHISEHRCVEKNVNKDIYLHRYTDIHTYMNVHMSVYLYIHMGECVCS